MLSGRVLADDPPFPVEVLRELLDGSGAVVDAPPRPWSGEDVLGLLAWEPVGKQDFDRLPCLRVVSTCSVGYDHIDVAAARQHGVWVCCVPDYCVDEVADSTLALLLSLLRGIVVLDRSVRDGGFDDHAAGPLRRLAGTRLGIVGFGRIGRAVAARASALGFDVWAHDPVVAREAIEQAGARPAGLDELLAGSDAVTLHVPLTAETEGLIGERELASMRRGSYLVNVSRADVLDWNAFLRALESGQLAGAAVDVLPVEPPTDESPAPELPNLIVTPHAAWYSPEAEQAVYRRAALSVLAVLEGREPEGAVVRP